MLRQPDQPNFAVRQFPESAPLVDVIAVIVVSVIDEALSEFVVEKVVVVVVVVSERKDSFDAMNFLRLFFRFSLPHLQLPVEVSENLEALVMQVQLGFDEALEKQNLVVFGLEEVDDRRSRQAGRFFELFVGESDFVFRRRTCTVPNQWK